MIMKRFYYIFILTLLFATGCSKDGNENIPLVNVNLFLNINNPEFIDLNAPGGWTYYIGGSRGLIVYRETNSSFKVYDRHCTFDVTNSCALVSVEVSNITAKDDCCGSQFLITDGSVTKNPATLPLKQYQTTFDGSVLHVFN